ncbi:MAG: SRPBCC family protein [Anaerolineae bacterium]|nr:SRPBCC family protein [Anaerolineae bacterium]
MRIEVNLHIFIHRSPAQVFVWLTDLDHWHQWGANVVSMKQLSAGPLQLGSRIRQVTKGGRTSRESIIEVTEYVADQRFGIEGSNVQGAFTLVPSYDGTRLDARFAVEATGFSALMYRLLLKQFVVKDLRQLKKMIESTEVTARRGG